MCDFDPIADRDFDRDIDPIADTGGWDLPF